jgi:hypothetical protein
MLDTADIATRPSPRPAASLRSAHRDASRWAPPGIGVFALCLTVSGLCCLLDPVTRPFSSEVGAAGARAFASSSWVVAHSFGLVALILLAAGAVIAAVAVWRSGRVPRWSAVPVATGVVLYIPQFAASQPVRIVHGLLMLVGCWWLAWALRSRVGSSR